MELEQFATEQKKLFDSMGQELTRTRAGFDEAKAALETFRAEQAQMRQEMTGRLDQVETRLATPAAGGGSKDAGPLVEYGKAWRGWATKGRRIPDNLITAVAQTLGLEGKALVVGDDTTGGYAAPHTVSNEVIANLIRYAPIRSLARVITIAQGDRWEGTQRVGRFTVSRKAEVGTVSVTGTPTFAPLIIPTHEYYAEPSASQKMLDDANFNVEAWISEWLAEDFADTAAADYVGGDGVQEPEGVTQNADIAHVASGNATLITLAGMVRLHMAIHPSYRARGTYAMNSNTLTNLYLLSNGVSQPYLLPDLRTANGFQFLGRPIVEFPELPDEGAGTFPVYFGDWNAGYYIVDRTDMQMLRDPYSSKPYVLFYTTWRTGGRVAKAEAIQKLECAVS